MDSSSATSVSVGSQKGTTPPELVDDMSLNTTKAKDRNIKAAESSNQSTETSKNSRSSVEEPTKRKKKTRRKRGKKKRALKRPVAVIEADSTTSEDESDDSDISGSVPLVSDSDAKSEPSRNVSQNSKKRTESRKTKSRRYGEKRTKKQHSDSYLDSDSDTDWDSDSDSGSDSSSTGKMNVTTKNFQVLQRHIFDIKNRLDELTAAPTPPPPPESQRLAVHRNPSAPSGHHGPILEGLMMRTRGAVAHGSKVNARPIETKPEKGGPPEYKRVDQIWDSSHYRFKLQESSKAGSDSQYSGYVYHIRRTFDPEGKYQQTYVDIKSKYLRECLLEVIGMIKGVSLVDEAPRLDPNMLFLYLEEFRTHIKELSKMSHKESKKNRLHLLIKRSHLKLLVKYLDNDYAKIKDSLYPMLACGIITFELVWALWKPNTVVYSPTYGCQEEPRAFKVESAQRFSSILRGEFYVIEGKYTEFDGKRFGYGKTFLEIPHFQGAKKITSLPLYPLKYHKNDQQIQRDLIERGKKFVALGGTQYKAFAGMAFMKRKKQIVKFSIQQSRIMVDSAIFRRINPNYQVSSVRPKNHDILSDDDISGDEAACSECLSDGDANNSGGAGIERVRYVIKAVRDDKGQCRFLNVPDDEGEAQEAKQKLDCLPAKDGAESTEESIVDSSQEKKREDKVSLPDLKDEDYLIASPVVFGFSFSEKQWLEFSVSGVNDIKWNDSAWDSLVLESKTKDLIHALVLSRKYNAAQTIDDVIQGKGKGLVTVLHGPPGTGKTLTAEGISELLKCPLYMVSAGELGTDSRLLEAELQKILDICHTWGAILLLDEADVFLEKRNMHDIHRNALVSIFLRQLEYFQGILFLTTNRVETFDEAFQSRIHIALKYEPLDAKARKAIFKMFIEKVRALGKLKLDKFAEKDFDALAGKNLNGREIKNIVGSAQDLAVNRKEALSMQHIRQVMEVHDKFGRDLRGGSGYDEVMRSYV
ncbi:ATPase family AAA domain-containingA-like-like protein [Cladobotryum mycophilum]|uniref:ATPase family AAA domain-containingA-like-like protein n=1 Tax=Cladobotryum mycophilum TaxID=491253 RepID=A0ABR0SY97_9HYPO